MAHEVNRLLGSITNVPLLTTPENLKQVQDYLFSRNAQEDFAIISQANAREMSEHMPPTVENGIGLMTIEGSLMYRWSFIAALCGLNTYQQMLSDFESMVEQGAHTVVMDMSSPGGEAYASMETAMRMRQIADENNVRIVTYVDGMAASAGYVFASISDEIIMNPMAKVGSIGVVISIVNDLPKKIEEGSEVVFVYSGESKIPYEKDGKLREDFIADLQKDTDLLYNDFIEHVEQFRRMSAGEIRDTKAKMFRPTDAIRMGLADKEMTSQEFIDYLAQLADGYERKMSQEQEGGRKMPLFGWKKKDKQMSAEENSEKELASEAPDASEASPSELLEGNQEGQEEASAESPSKQSKENNEVNMTLEEMLASPEAQAKIKAEAEKQSAEFKQKLSAFEAEKEEAAKASYKELVSGYSFVAQESQEKVATFLYEASEMSMDGVKEIMEALESAKTAVEAVVEEEHGDEGAALQNDPEEASKSAVSDLIAKRYAKK